MNFENNFNHIECSVVFLTKAYFKALKQCRIESYRIGQIVGAVVEG